MHTPATVAPHPTSHQNGLDDYQQSSVTNLPKIKQKLAEIKAATTRINAKSQSQQRVLNLEEQPNGPPSEGIAKADRTMGGSSDHTAAWQESALKMMNQTNFYSTFNFSVLHSKGADFVNARQKNTVNQDDYHQSVSPQKTMNAVHRAGGAQEKSWLASRSVVFSNIDKNSITPQLRSSTVMQKSGQYEALKFRPTHNVPIGADQNEAVFTERTASMDCVYEGSGSQVLRLKKFSNLMTDPASPIDHAPLQVSRKNYFGGSYKLIPLNRKNIKDPQLSVDFMGNTDFVMQSTLTESTFAEPSQLQVNSLLVQTTEAGISNEFVQYDSHITQSAQQSVDIPSNLVKQLKKKLQNQYKIEIYPPNLQNSLLIPRKENRDEIEVQQHKRESQLKRRPKFRANSANQRTKTLEKTLYSKGFVNVIKIQTDGLLNNGNTYDDQTERQPDRALATENTTPIKALQEEPFALLLNKTTTGQSLILSAVKHKFTATLLENAAVPRLGQIIHKKESKTFKEALGLYNFKGMMQDCTSEEDRRIINLAYQEFMSVLEVQKEQKQAKIKQESLNDSDDSNLSLVLEEDGGPRIECKELVSSDKLLGKFVKAISKKLQKYTQKLARDLENAAYSERIKNLNITGIQAELDIDKILKRKRMPLEGEDLKLAALEKVYLVKGKSDRIQAQEVQGFKEYTAFLQDQNQSEFQTCTMPLDLVSKIRRGFIVFPGGKNELDKIDCDELIDDPAALFDNYLFRKTQRDKSYGDDFWEKLEITRLSGIFNFNSTIFQMKETGKVAFIKKSNLHSELALPILAKIKNRELILSDYRLEYGHFEALKASFAIEPDLVHKISLNNCGIDDQSFACFLEGCLHLKVIQHIQITKGEFGIKSVEVLKKVLAKPGCLQSLKLNDIDLQPSTSMMLFEALTQKCYLRVLSLANFNFTGKSFEQFTSYFQKTQQLQELQMSNLTGVTVTNWSKFMQILPFNKTIRDLDLSWNNFIENQDLAMEQLKNPYKVFKQVYEKWIKQGPGSRWPGPESVLSTIHKPKIDPRKTPAGKKVVTLPLFSLEEGKDQIFDRYAHIDDMEEMVKDKLTSQVEKLMKQSIRQAFVLNFMAKAIKKRGTKGPEPTPQPPVQFGSEPFEVASTQATVVTEAIYKFIRRNSNLQHLNLTRCNLTQVMVARIGLGAKCSSSLMSIHLTDNPGVTAAVKAFLQVKMRAAPPPVKENVISNQFIESDSELQKQIALQMEYMKAEQSLASETVAIREMNKKKQDGSFIPQDITAKDERTLMFTRLLGHKYLLPGSGRWLIMTSPKDECWICKKYVYSMFFWSPKQIAKTQVPANYMIDKDKIIDRLDVSCSDETENPIIYGNFTDWQPKEMQPVKKFAEIPRSPEVPNFLTIVKSKYGLPDKFEYLDLNPDQRQVVTALKHEYETTTSENWRQHIAAYTRFKDVQLINYEHLNASNFKEWQTEASFDDLLSNPIYVYAAMVKPGKQYYLVQHATEPHNLRDDFSSLTISRPGTDQQQERTSNTLRAIMIPQDRQITFYLHKSLVPLREDPIPMMSKLLISSEVERVFNKDASVFKPWKPDNAASLSKCTDNDLLAMNLAKLVKEETEMTKLKNVIKKHMPYLKQCHLDMVVTSNLVPYVTYLDFVHFYKECGFVDYQLQAANIDLIYTQVNTNQKNIVGINRGEFIEALIRIAKAKYKDTGACETLDEALNNLIEKNIKPSWGDSLWHQTRVTKFWTCEINDLLEANIEGIKRVFTLFWDLKAVNKKKWMEIREADYFLTQSMPDLKLTINTARRCYFYSKMSCIDEQTNVASYNKMIFVEFLECLCRIALDHYEDTPMRDWPLVNRLENVLDNVLQLKNVERRAVLIETQIDSDADISDVDY